MLVSHIDEVNLFFFSKQQEISLKALLCLGSRQLVAGSCFGKEGSNCRAPLGNAGALGDVRYSPLSCAHPGQSLQELRLSRAAGSGAFPNM